MNIEALSEMDAIELSAWDEKEAVAQWNGRDINVIKKHQEDRISSIALQRAHFNNAQTGYVLCKNERDSDPRSESRSSDNKTLQSNEDSKKPNDKESKSDDKQSNFDIKQSISVDSKPERDNHGHSSNEARLSYRNRINFEDGKFLDVGAKFNYERHVDRSELSDKMSGEIDASYNF